MVFGEILSFPLLGVAAERFLYKRQGFCAEEAHSTPGGSVSAQKGKPPRRGSPFGPAPKRFCTQGQASVSRKPIRLRAEAFLYTRAGLCVEEAHSPPSRKRFCTHEQPPVSRKPIRPRAGTSSAHPSSLPSRESTFGPGPEPLLHTRAAFRGEEAHSAPGRNRFCTPEQPSVSRKLIPPRAGSVSAHPSSLPCRGSPFRPGPEPLVHTRAAFRVEEAHSAPGQKSSGERETESRSHDNIERPLGKLVGEAPAPSADKLGGDSGVPGSTGPEKLRPPPRRSGGKRKPGEF